MADYPREEYSNLVPPFGDLSYTMDFDNLYRLYFNQLTCIALRLILIKGLPETIDETFLKYCILISGKAVFFEIKEEILEAKQSGSYPIKPGDLVALNGNDSNMQTIYYMHRNVLVTNPVFNETYKLQPGVDCEIVYCTQPDRYKVFRKGGLFPLIARTATILADNDISINCAQKNTRLHNVIAADDESTAISAEAAIEGMYNGDPYSVVQKHLVGELTGIPMTQNTNTNNIVQLLEMRQYVYSHFYEQLGLSAPHDNMKKERLITAEMNDSNEIAALNIDDIIATIQEGLDRVNAMFGTSITASLNPIVIKAQEDPEDMTEDKDQSEAAGTDPEEAAAQTEDEDQSEAAGTDPEEAAAQTEDEDQSKAPEISIEIKAEDEATVEINIEQGGDSDVQNPDAME